ncbi:MAG: hypothetical protein IJ574_00875 [Bacilli bacterium]|nr:hypothetical protein [Bacilli bacterium]
MFVNELLLKKIQEEKEELRKLYNFLENNYPKTDISNVYVMKSNNNNILSIVKIEIIPIKEKKVFEKIVGYKALVKNVFTGKYIGRLFLDIEYPIYDQIIKGDINYHLREENDYNIDVDMHVQFSPILEVAPELLAYVNNEVPIYVLQKIYYELNNIDINDEIYDEPSAKKRKY